MAGVAALLLAGSALLAGCGASDGAETDGGSASSGGTRTITDTYLGDVKDVPVKPKRVLALWRTGAELADLGVEPVGTLTDEMKPEELGSAYSAVSDTPIVGSTEGVDLEKVIALEPDLIIGMDRGAGALSIDYKELQQVAPTVIFRIAEPPDVWANYPKVADAVGLSSDFDAENERLDSGLTAIKEEYGEELAGKSITSLGADDTGTIYVDTAKALSYERMTAAGFGYNPTYTEDPERYATALTQENIASLADQDAIFFDAGPDGKPVGATAKMLELPSFRQLPAARAGHVYPFTSGVFYTFAAAQQQVKDLRTAAADLTG